MLAAAGGSGSSRSAHRSRLYVTVYDSSGITSLGYAYASKSFTTGAYTLVVR